MTSRNYRSPVRAEQSRLTRARILTAAGEGFVRDGYAATAVSGVAAAARVSAQTIYNTFGSKAGLLKAVYDVRLAGDDEPVAMADRAELQRLRTITDPRELLMAYAHVGAGFLDRIGPLAVMVAEGAAAGDAELADLVEVTGRERLTGARGIVGQLGTLGGLRPGLDAGRAAEIIWTLNSYAVWDLLVRQRGWTSAAYADFIGRAMADALLAPPLP